MQPGLPPPLPAIPVSPPPFATVVPPPLPVGYFNTEPLQYQTGSVPLEWVTIASIDSTGQWFSAKRQLAVYHIECIMQTETGTDATWLAVPAQSVKLANQVLFPSQNLQPKVTIDKAVGGFPMDQPASADPSQTPQELVNVRPVVPISAPANSNRYLPLQVILWIILGLALFMLAAPILGMIFGS